MQQVSFSRLPGRYVLLLCWHDVFLRCYHIPLSQNVAPLLHPSNLQLCALMSPAVWIGDVSETSIAKVSVFLVFFFCFFFTSFFMCLGVLSRLVLGSTPHSLTSSLSASDFCSRISFLVTFQVGRNEWQASTVGRHFLTCSHTGSTFQDGRLPRAICCTPTRQTRKGQGWPHRIVDQPDDP